MSNLDWLQAMNDEALDNADEENQKQAEIENTMEYQCQRNTIDGKICRFIKQYAESQDPPLEAGFEWNGVVSWFTVGGESVSMQAGRYLDGSGRLTIQKSELEKNKWWHDALFNNPEMNLPAENLDIVNDEKVKKNTEHESRIKNIEEHLDSVVDTTEKAVANIIEQNESWFEQNKIDSNFLQNSEKITWFKKIMEYKTENGDLVGEVKYDPKTKTVSYQINKFVENEKTGESKQVFQGKGLTQNILLDSVEQLRARGLEVQYFEANWMSAGTGHTVTNLEAFHEALEQNPDKSTAALQTPSGKAFERAFGTPQNISVEENPATGVVKVLFEMTE